MPKRGWMIGFWLCYAAVIMLTSIFVPVVASMDDHHSIQEFGYLPIWEIEAVNEPGLTIHLNYLAWIVQLLFITSLFVYIRIKILRYLKSARLKRMPSPSQ